MVESLHFPPKEAAMKRLTVIMVVIFALSALLTACGGGAVANDPVSVVKAAMQSLVDKKFDALAELTCAAKKDTVKMSFSLAAGFLRGMDVDATKILDMMTITIQKPEYTKVSEEADKAVVQIKGTLSAKFDEEKFKVVMKDLMKAQAQGQDPTDEQLAMAVLVYASELGSDQVLDQKVDVIKENGKWVMCPENAEP
jgi:hypothetical protein